MVTLNNNNGLGRGVIGLIRFSTAEQVAEGKAGEARQRTLIQAAAARHGYTIIREVVAIDVSGRHVRLDPQFQQLFADLANPAIAGVVVSEQSRIFRPDGFDDYAILEHFASNKKLILTPGEQIEAWTSAGRMSLILNGMMSGEELIKIKDRCMSGKAEDRKEGKNPGGNHMLPRGVRYVRERNIDGKVVAERWAHDEVEVDRVRRAYEMLFNGLSFEAIAEGIGGGWTGKGIHDSLRNPIWRGIRRYAYEATGPEILRKGSTKPVRKVVKRAVPLEVKIDLPAIISDEAWDKAQEIITARAAVHAKSKLKQAGRPRFLASGITRCTCGQVMYGQYGGRGSHLDTYYCQSRHKGGKGCGAVRLKRADVDEAISRLIVERLLDADFVLGVMAAAAEIRETADPHRATREAALAGLIKGRSELLAMVRSGLITSDEFKAEIGKLEIEKRAIEATLPVQLPALDPARYAEMLMQAFAAFDTLPFADRRAILAGAVREITIDAATRTIPTLTVDGGYVGRGASGIGANSAPPLTTRCEIRSVPDVTFRFPQPVAIPDTYIDGRLKNGSHPGFVAAQYRRAS